MNKEQIKAIKSILAKADKIHLPLWLESGWAIDARLGRITREHEDIDVAYPMERESEYKNILKKLGFKKLKKMDYGFIIYKRNVELDSEPCFVKNKEYTFRNFPLHSCPLEQKGVIDGIPVRCLSWEAMYFEFLGYIDKTPKEKWRPKDFESLKIIKKHISASKRSKLNKLFNLHKKI